MTTLTLPSGLPSGNYWFQEDSRGISQGAARGVARAERGDWTSGTKADRIQDFRDYLVFRNWLAGRLAGQTGVSAEKTALVIAPDFEAARAIATQNPRARAVMLIGETQRLIASRVDRTWEIPSMFATGQGPDVNDVGALPLVAIAIVTVVVAVAESAAVAYLAHEAAQVVDNFLARDQALKGLVQADAAVLRVVDEHAEREMTEGKALPLDDAETRALDALEERQKTFQKNVTPPKPIDSGSPWWMLPAAIAAAAAAGFVLAKL